MSNTASFLQKEGKRAHPECPKPRCCPSCLPQRVSVECPPREKSEAQTGTLKGTLLLPTSALVALHEQRMHTRTHTHTHIHTYTWVLWHSEEGGAAPYQALYEGSRSGILSETPRKGSAEEQGLQGHSSCSTCIAT